jgi:EmrB/QacA subfamily drug resistance transporter
MTAQPPRSHYLLTFAVLALAGLSFALLQSLVAPALPVIQRDLHTTTTAVTWILTGYLLSASVATPIAGRLGDMFGKERMLVIVLSLTALGTALAGLASSIEALIAARVIQGLGGAVFPLAFGIIRDEFPRERVATGIALVSAILGIGGGAGIVLAGPIVEGLSYHWLFWLPLGTTALAAIAAALFIPESPVKTPGRINWLGAALLSGWLVCLLVAFSKAVDWGWTSTRFLGLLAAAAVLLVIWVWAELRAPEPLVDMRMLRRRPVWTTNLTGLLIGFGMFGSFILVPQFVETPEASGFGFGASVTEAGLFLVPSTFTMLLSSPIAARLTNRLGPKVPLAIGALITALAFVLLAFQHDEAWHIYLMSALLGAGMGMAFAAMANLIVQAVPPEQTGVATGMNTIMRTIGGSIGGQVTAAVVAAHISAAGLPQESGFTLAFVVSAGALVIAFLSALAVPGRPGPGAGAARREAPAPGAQPATG